MDPEALARIPIHMKAFVGRTIAGAVTLVARHGVVASLEAVGYQDLETKTPMRNDTIFKIASMTKPVTAVGIMILLDKGRLALDDPVEKHLPEFKGISVSERREGKEEHELRPPSRAITLYDLLTHTSGVVPGRIPLGQRGPGHESLLEFTLAESVAYVAQFPLVSQPGTQYAYNNWGFSILGRIIEVVSGQPYEQFVEETILKPLGMVDSFFFVPSDRRERIATVCTLDDGELKVRQGPGIYGLLARRCP